jgi:hypothetical protein
MVLEFLIVLLFSMHVSLFFDISSLQKRPACKLNFLIGNLIATIPPLMFSYLTAISSQLIHISAVAVITFISSILVISTIQKYLDYEINF